ncbi:MAG: serine/threonine-protein kinase, partial [Kofleriaceae bacterium]
MSSGVSPHDATTPVEGGPLSAHGELARGTVVGRYEIVRVLGRGGMGAVYAGYDPQLDRQIALKLLHPGSRIAPATLIGEAKALARLDDPHVVQIFDAGEHAGEVFIAMQLVHGEDLRSALARRHPKPPQILGWFVAAGRGLAAAHAAGLVHRDFKPSNVLIDRRGRVGLAVNLHDPGATAKGFAGTPLYMAPEQHALAAASEASDQFAFCVALWEALFGRHPYVKHEEGSPALVGHQIAEAALVAPSRGHAVPRRVVDALTRGLSRDPGARWPNMNALLAQLVPQPRRRWPLLVLAGAAVDATGVAV